MQLNKETELKPYSLVSFLTTKLCCVNLIKTSIKYYFPPPYRWGLKYADCILWRRDKAAKKRESWQGCKTGFGTPLLPFSDQFWSGVVVPFRDPIYGSTLSVRKLLALHRKPHNFIETNYYSQDIVIMARLWNHSTWVRTPVVLLRSLSDKYHWGRYKTLIPRA